MRRKEEGGSCLREDEGLMGRERRERQVMD